MLGLKWFETPRAAFYLAWNLRASRHTDMNLAGWLPRPWVSPHQAPQVPPLVSPDETARPQVPYSTSHRLSRSATNHQLAAMQGYSHLHQVCEYTSTTITEDTHRHIRISVQYKAHTGSDKGYLLWLGFLFTSSGWVSYQTKIHVSIGTAYAHLTHSETMHVRSSYTHTHTHAHTYTYTYKNTYAQTHTHTRTMPTPTPNVLNRCTHLYCSVLPCCTPLRDSSSLLLGCPSALLLCFTHAVLLCCTPLLLLCCTPRLYCSV